MTETFAIFTPDTGHVRFVTTLPDEVEFNLRPGEQAEPVETGSDNTTHYVKDGVLYAYTPAEREDMSTPRPGHTWIPGTGWADLRTLEQLKAIKWAQIKDARQDAEEGGFTWDGSTFDSDAMSQMRIIGAAQMASVATAAGQPFEITWTLADNTTRTLSAEDMLMVGLTMGAHIDATHAHGRELRTQLDAATTREEVAAINW